MRFNRTLMTSFMVIFLMHGLLVAEPQQVTVGEIKNSLVCLCECNMTVEACQGSMACKSADDLTLEAEQFIAKGMNKQAILSAFTTKYGEHILAAPTKKGFNLIAWILPFLLILLAGTAIVFMLKRWVIKQQLNSNGGQNNGAPIQEADIIYQKKLDDVLSNLD